MLKIMVFAGTRPEAIKVASVVRELVQSESLSVTLCSTGQHREMLEQAFADFEISPDYDLNVMRPDQTLAGLSARLFETADALFDKEKPDWVLVQGDTTTVAIVSMCAYYRQIRVGHIEAGLRSHQKYSPFPEEINRRIAGVIADLHFAPTDLAYDNLMAENVSPEQVVVVGNTVIDALLWMRDKVANEVEMLPPEVIQAQREGKKVVLVTGHRRESFGDGFLNICKAIRKLADTRNDVFFAYPVHLNPKVQEPVYSLLGNHPSISLISPMAYKPFVALMATSHLILTDSGGIQEEGPALGKPVLIMREVTERPEGVDAGTAKLVGTETARIIAEVTQLLDDENCYAAMAQAINPYGDGHAAARIVKMLEKYAAS
nr:UDP-N-acetylglucosamine 2-epimerase (non-hydrolyzing) [Pseudodesulfovibrio sp.]